MSTNDRKLSDRIESDLTKALKFMNRYGLTEFEFEDRETGQSIQLERTETESSPPLLEGRQKDVAGVIYSPAVGKISWKVDSGQAVRADETVAQIEKHREVVEVTAPVAGRIVDLLPAEPVEFGEKLARVETGVDPSGK